MTETAVKAPADWSYDGAFLSVAAFNDFRRDCLKEAQASFEKNRQPGVLYRGPEMVQRGTGWFLEWTPIGFTTARTQTTDGSELRR